MNNFTHTQGIIIFPGGSLVKTLPTNAGDADSTSGSERCLGRGKNNPLHCSCLENSMDRGAWWATVHGVAGSWTTQTHTHRAHKPSLSFNTCYFTETLGWHKASKKRNSSPGDRLWPYILFRTCQKSFLLLLISNKWIPQVWEREAQLNHETQGTTSIWHFL